MEPQQRPPVQEVPAFYHGYLEQAPGTALHQALEASVANLSATLDRVPDDAAALHRYAPGKWSLKEVLQHIIDSERIFAYRALRFARNDRTELPGFDEGHYAEHADADRRTWSDLLREYAEVTRSTASLFGSFSPEMLLRGGIANGQHITVRGIGWVIAGHAEHHRNIIQQRYLGHG